MRAKLIYTPVFPPLKQSKDKGYVFQSDKNGDWYWRIVAPNGETVAQNEGYKTKEAAIKTLKRFNVRIYLRESIVIFRP